MRKLIVHAGSHKTGSTSIQMSLVGAVDQLMSKGIALFSKDPDGSENRFGHSNHWVRHYGSGCDFDAEVRSELKDELSRLSSDIVVFSAEHLFWLHSQKNIQSFYELLVDQFDSIEVVFYLRRQDQLLLSHHQQGSKHLGWCEQLYYGSDPTAYPTGDFPEYLDYFSKLKKWVEVFGKGSIKVRVFDKSQLYGGDVVSDFCSIVDKSLTVEALRVNESRSKHQVIVGHLLNSMGISHLNDRRVNLIGSIDSEEKLLPCRRDAEEVYSRYRLSNKYLNEFLDISSSEYLFEEDFEGYPQEIKVDYLDTLRLVLEKGSMQSVFSAADIFALRDAAIALEKTNPKVAYRLIGIARSLRPNGKIINDVYQRLGKVVSELSS